MSNAESVKEHTAEYKIDNRSIEAKIELQMSMTEKRRHGTEKSMLTYMSSTILSCKLFGI